MKRKSKKIVLLLMLAFVLSAVFSCANSGGAQNDKDAPAGEQGGGDPADTAAIPEKPAHDMPEKNYNGYNFTFLVKEFDGNGYWGAQDVFAEEENGDPINDSVYKRNRIIEDRYNVNICEKRAGAHGAPVDTGKKSILAGTHEYDVIMPDLNGGAGLAAQGLLMDLSSNFPYVQFDRVWWDQRANKMLTLGGAQYFLIGDMTLMTNDATWVIMFNKKVVEEYGMGNLYSHVKEDNWSFDTFFGLVRQVSKDLDGNGKFDENDQVGLLTDNGAKTIMVYNTGEMVARKDDKDLPYLALNTERAINVAGRVFEVLSDKTVCIHANDLKMSDPWTNGVNKMFQEDKGLFYMLSLTVMHKMRNMDSDFGVLPFPKFDKSQAEYYHTVQPSTANSMVFPVTTTDPEMASIIVEDMCYEARDTVRHAYFDVTITNKTIRDEESAEMLDLIFGTRIYDLGFIFNWSSIGYLLESVYPDAGRFTSKYEAAETKALAAMEKTIDEVNRIG